MHSIRSQVIRAGLISIILGCGLPMVQSSLAQHGHHQNGMPGVMEYLDRLDRPERDQEQKPAQVVEALALKPGMRIADLGAGSGYFTRRFVEAVTERGKVYVVDIELQALKHIEKSLVQMQKPYDAEFIMALPDNPKLPGESVDVIFVCNTYHHLDDRTKYVRNILSALRPGGRLVIIDFYHDERSGELGFPKHHLVAREQVMKEVTAAGYRLVKEHTFLPKQYFLEFSER